MAMTNAERQQKYRERLGKHRTSLEAAIENLSREIYRRRKENGEKRKTSKWNPDNILKVEQRKLIDFIEEELQKILERRVT